MTPTLEKVGNDLVVRHVRCTCFGGAHDRMDNGQTASGVSTKPPGTLGVALPRKYTGPNKAVRKALGNGIIPEGVPFFACVEVTEHGTGKKWTAPFIDLGPATQTGNHLDVTVAVARKFNSEATANDFEMMCDYRIIGGAEYMD